MLRPTKHTHPDRTVINVALRLLSRLRERRVEGFEELRGFVRDALTGCETLLLPALSFLYLLGLVEYRPKVDSFEYVGPR